MKNRYYYDPMVRKDDNGIPYLNIYRVKNRRGVLIGMIDGSDEVSAIRRARATVVLLNSKFITIDEIGNDRQC